jgi:hypothetical protein
MTALTQERLVEERLTPRDRVFGLKAGVTVYLGAIVVQTGGFARNGITAAGLTTVGIAEETATGGAADGDVKIRTKRGTFKFVNAAGADAVLASHVGQDCYVLDDQTVTITATGRSVAGKVYQLDADGGVWVEIR